MLKIVKVTTNYMENPLGIDCGRRPLFSWQYENCFQLRQKAYRIRISDSLEKISNGEANIWDSGKVSSSLSCGVSYGGPLEAQKIYYGTIEAETTQGTAQSDVFCFETAPDANIWEGIHWVVSSINAVNSSSLIRANVTLADKKIVRARAYVAVLGFFELYINGKKTDDVFMNPVVTDPSKRMKYCVYDVTDFLHSGANAVGVFLAQGWTDFRRMRWVMDVWYEDGERERITTNEAKLWEVAGPVVHCSLYGGEVYDANIAEKYKNWATTKFALDGRPYFQDWGISLRTEDTLGIVMEPQALVGMKRMEIIAPASKKVFSENRSVYTFDRHFSGWVRIRVKGEKGAKVTIRYAEVIDANGELNVTNLRYARCTDVYILCGQGEEEYAPRFTYRGFCFAEVSVDGKAEILSVMGEYIKTGVKQIGSFKCSDPILNRLHQNILDTEGGNQNGTLTDCNQRNERFGWLNDLCSRIYQVVNNYDMSVFLEKILEDITDTMDEKGAIADTAPNFFIGSRPSEPAAVCYLLAARFLYDRYGNKQVVEQYYPYFCKLVDFFYNMTEDGILYFSRYGDWVPPYVNSEKDIRRNTYAQTGAFSTEIMYWYLTEIMHLAEILGRKSDAVAYAEKAAFVRRKFNEKFYNENTGVYGSGTQTENVLPIVLDMIPQDRKEKLVRAMVNDVIRLGYHSSCGNIAYRPLFTALMEAGEDELIQKILVNKEYPGWGYMVAQGAISVWERWEKDIQHLAMQSLAHPMFGSYDVWFYEGLGGIRLREYCRGISEFVLHPRFNKGIDFVECSLETVHGMISSNWKREDGSVRYSFTVPPNTVCKLYLDMSPKELPDGIVAQQDGYLCGSGSYCIELKYRPEENHDCKRQLSDYGYAI